MWYIYTMDYYSAIKSNKIGSFVDTWIDLQCREEAYGYQGEGDWEELGNWD